MPNVLVRDLDVDVLKQLKAAAKANGRSLQAEIHARARLRRSRAGGAPAARTARCRTLSPLAASASHFVYIVRCADGSLYTGSARDPDARVLVHNAGKGAKYTASRLPVTLVYREACASLGAALTREHQIKTLSRARKDALVAGND